MQNIYILSEKTEYGHDAPVIAFEDIMQAWHYIDKNYVYEEFEKLFHKEGTITWMNDDYVIHYLDIGA